MRFEPDVFFREATLRICGSLEAEVFLPDSFEYIRGFIPADRVALTYYDPQKKRLAALALASGAGSSVQDMSVPALPAVRRFIRRTDASTLVVDRAEEHPTARPWISKGILEPDSSLLIVRLVLGKENIGAVIFMATGSGRFSRKHAGVVDMLREPFAIALSNCVRYRQLLELKDLLVEDNRFLHGELRQIAGEEIVGADFGLRGVMEMVRQVAPLSSPVLLLGETGTGKELVANAIHNLSPRKEGPFIKVNCGAIPESLIDSELFGHEKGAFTGALFRKRGRFELAHGGTIFLDEVGELRPAAQVRLLRVLQEKVIERVGASETIKVDIRIIAATHRDLEAMIREETFREDLYFRLKVFPIPIPALRERKGDIASLVHYFMRTKAREIGRSQIPALAPADLESLMAYDWPGNVRELENVIERALILNRGHAGPLSFRDLHTRPDPVSPADPDERLPSLDEAISRHIRAALTRTGGKVGGKQGAAQLLGVNPSTLRKKMKKLKIPFGRGVA